jgi:2-polyprenyl-3-methyl-5-hydroxy-6-metoxy-1,4-benzoquinol methylase
MNQTIHYQQCPACQSVDIKSALTAKDHTVSQENFEIWHCQYCSLRFTQDIPVLSAIGPYYQSEEYVSHSDSQKGLINNLYHRVRNHTLETKRQLLQTVTSKKQGALLDVGAGTGAFSKTMQDAGWQVTGLEPDDTARKNAKALHGLDLQSPDQVYHLADAQFDAITLWHVLEHVHDLQGYLENFHRLLKATGKLIIAVPNYTSKDAQTYGAFWAAYDVPRHLYHFSPNSMEILAKNKGFQVDQMKPMWFDSVYVSMLSEKCKTGATKLIPALMNGLLSNANAIGNAANCSSVIYILSKTTA